MDAVERDVQLLAQIDGLEQQRWNRPLDCRPGALGVTGRPLPWRAHDVLRRADLAQRTRKLQSELAALERVVDVLEPPIESVPHEDAHEV